MVVHLFGDQRGPRHEAEGGVEVGEGEDAGDRPAAVGRLPVAELLQRRGALGRGQLRDHRQPRAAIGAPSEVVGLLDDVGPAADRIPRREQDEAIDGEGRREETAAQRQVLGDGAGVAAAQPRQRHVRRVLAAFGRQADALEDALLLGLQIDAAAAVGSTFATSEWWLRVPSAPMPVTRTAKGARRIAGQALGGVLGDHHVDVADEAERQVVVLRVDPAGAGKPAAQKRQALGEFVRDLDPGEQARHRRGPRNPIRFARISGERAACKGRGTRVPPIIDGWPEAVRALTTFHPWTSMEYFFSLNLAGQGRGMRAPFSVIYVDGNHALEYASFDLWTSASYLQPGGAIVLDNIDVMGVRATVETFLAGHEHWRLFDDGLPGKLPCESLLNSFSAILIAPNGIDVGPAPVRIYRPAGSVDSIKELRIPVRSHDVRGDLEVGINLIFAVRDKVVAVTGIASAKGRTTCRLEGGVDTAVVTFDPPVTIAPPDVPGVRRLEIEMAFRPSPGSRTLLLKPLLDIG